MRKLILGGAQFGEGYGTIIPTGKLSEKSISGILETALSNDCSTIDIAEAYQNVVTNLNKCQLRSQFNYINKISFIQNDVSLSERLNRSLESLSISSFEAILIHNWSTLQIDEKRSAVERLLTLKSAGITKRIGISIYDPNEIEGEVYEIDVIQAPLNFYKRDFVSCLAVKKLVDSGVEFHARSIFNQGLLLNLNEHTLGRFPELIDFQDYCIQSNMTLLEGALSIFDYQGVFSQLVVGVSSTSDLKAISKSGVRQTPIVHVDWKFLYKSSISDPRLWFIQNTQS